MYFLLVLRGLFITVFKMLYLKYPYLYILILYQVIGVSDEGENTEHAQLAEGLQSQSQNLSIQEEAMRR